MLLSRFPIHSIAGPDPVMVCYLNLFSCLLLPPPERKCGRSPVQRNRHAYFNQLGPYAPAAPLVSAGTLTGTRKLVARR